MHVAGSRSRRSWHELLVALLVALGPGRAQDAPLPWRRGLVGAAAPAWAGLRDRLRGLRSAGWACGVPARRWSLWIEGGGGGRLGRLGLRPARAAGRAWGARPACATTDRLPTASVLGRRRLRRGASTSAQPTSTMRIPLPPSRDNNSGLDCRGVFRRQLPGPVQVRRVHAATFAGSVAISASRRRDRVRGVVLARAALHDRLQSPGTSAGCRYRGWRHRRAHSVMSYS